MIVKVIGSNLCPDTLYALYKLRESNVDIDFQNISTNFPALKEYLKNRENNPLYEAVREANGIGIPFFELEDGFQTLDLDYVLKNVIGV